jgi:uncharacterized RDD family membrane protein YckC
MMSSDQYIHQVIDNLPNVDALRSQIAMELRSHIAERVERGQPVDEAIQQLGDPLTLAESYLAAVPLVSASFGDRAAAKVIDVLLFVVIGAPLTWLVWRGTVGPWFAFVPGLLAFAFWFYTVFAEYLYGQTLGKYLLGLRVVRESGARITLGQAVVRQLPMLFQVALIDIFFALFTEKSQRAAELLSKTRVVEATRV